MYICMYNEYMYMHRYLYNRTRGRASALQTHNADYATPAAPQSMPRQQRRQQQRPAAGSAQKPRPEANTSSTSGSGTLAGGKKKNKSSSSGGGGGGSSSRVQQGSATGKSSRSDVHTRPATTCVIPTICCRGGGGLKPSSFSAGPGASPPRQAPTDRKSPTGPPVFQEYNS